MSKSTKLRSYHGMLALGVVFMILSLNEKPAFVALGAAFIAIGAALARRQKKKVHNSEPEL